MSGSCSPEEVTADEGCFNHERVTMRLVSLKWTCAAVVAGCLAMGCAAPEAPPPQTPNDTSSETGMPEPVLLDVLDPAIDEAAQDLIVELPAVPAVKAAANKQVFAL